MSSAPNHQPAPLDLAQFEGLDLAGVGPFLLTSSLYLDRWAERPENAIKAKAARDAGKLIDYADALLAECRRLRAELTAAEESEDGAMRHADGYHRQVLQLRAVVKDLLVQIETYSVNGETLDGSGSVQAARAALAGQEGRQQCS